MPTKKEIIKKEIKILSTISPNSFKPNLINLPDWVDNQKINYWYNLGFELHYLPNITAEQILKINTWKIKPTQIFYKKIQQGKINPTTSNLSNKWILVDAKNRPDKNTLWITQKDVLFLKKLNLNPQKYFKTKNTQFFQNDYLLPILKKINSNSRFCLSINAIQHILPHILNILKINNQKVIIRLPYFIEYNYLSNFFYYNWSTPKTWEWFADTYEKHQYLVGGAQSNNCLGWESPNFWSTLLTFRPLIEI